MLRWQLYCCFLQFVLKNKLQKLENNFDGIKTKTVIWKFISNFKLFLKGVKLSKTWVTNRFKMDYTIFNFIGTNM